MYLSRRLILILIHYNNGEIRILQHNQVMRVNIYFLINVRFFELHRVSNKFCLKFSFLFLFFLFWNIFFIRIFETITTTKLNLINLIETLLSQLVFNNFFFLLLLLNIPILSHLLAEPTDISYILTLAQLFKN